MCPVTGDDGESILDAESDIQLELPGQSAPAESLPAFTGAFPLQQRAYLTLPSDGATEMLCALFAGEEGDGLRQQIVEALRPTGKEPSPAEFSVSLLPYLQPIMRSKESGNASAFRYQQRSLSATAESCGRVGLRRRRCFVRSVSVRTGRQLRVPEFGWRARHLERIGRAAAHVCIRPSSRVDAPRRACP